MNTFSVSIYNNGSLGYSNLQSLHWDELDYFENWLSNLVQGPGIRIEIVEFE